MTVGTAKALLRSTVQHMNVAELRGGLIGELAGAVGAVVVDNQNVRFR